ncbi:MAG TPA: DUF4965 domain-containing protein [Tepidisphaeraceae bacterium]|nr:DUF4965 domain-containing protein [Tepidisphaeraceae bacterium]
MNQSVMILVMTAAAALFAHGLPARAADTDLPPLRPPAVPLVTTDPYFSIWSFDDHLNDADTHHWTGKPQTLLSLVRIDGKAYRLAGAQPSDAPAMQQTNLLVLPTRTFYTFTGGGVTLTLTFTTPMLPVDLDVLSRPLTYVTWNAVASDGQSHQVSAMLAMGGDIAVNTPDEAVVAHRQTFGTLTAMSIGSEAQPILRSKGDDHRIDWGYLYVTARDAAGMAIGNAGVLASTFADSGNLPASDDTRFPRPVRDGLPSAAVVVDLGAVGNQNVARHAMVAYDDLFSIQYMKRNLRPYWRRNGMDAGRLLQTAEAEYANLAERCAKFDDDLIGDARSTGGEAYARICALAYRQALAAQKIVADANGMPLAFCKENFSNGCIATVDVIYPQLPQLLLTSPALAKAALVPLLDYASSDRWHFDFAPHDLGTYPQANGQVYGGGERTEDNQMPVEESGNMLALLAAVAKADGNADFAGKYWPAITRWAKYLEAKGFDPEKQLCTDDFAGHLAHNTNLSIKAIMGLGSYSMLCETRGDKTEAARVRAIARSFADRWVTEAADGDHSRLTFDKRGTWSQKYNLVWDKVLGLNLFPKSVAQKEIAFYLTKQNKYGLPLDSRSTYTKLDWTIWTATLADRRADFERIVTPVYDFLNDSPSRVPMTDWYFTDSGKQRGFQARPVVGGVFIKMLSDDSMWRNWAGRAQKVTGEWAPMPTPPTVEVIEPGSKMDGVIWRYTTDRPADGWMSQTFNDHSWKKGPGGFGTNGTPGAMVRTRWNTPDIYIRREIIVPAGTDIAALQLYVHHDEDATIYLNGVLAAQISGFTTDYDPVEIIPAAKAALKPGTNLLAVHCHQTVGGQYIDVGLARIKE